MCLMLCVEYVVLNSAINSPAELFIIFMYKLIYLLFYAFDCDINVGVFIVFTI